MISRACQTMTQFQEAPHRELGEALLMRQHAIHQPSQRAHQTARHQSQDRNQAQEDHSKRGVIPVHEHQGDSDLWNELADEREVEPVQDRLGCRSAILDPLHDLTGAQILVGEVADRGHLLHGPDLRPVVRTVGEDAPGIALQIDEQMVHEREDAVEEQWAIQIGEPARAWDTIQQALEQDDRIEPDEDLRDTGDQKGNQGHPVSSADTGQTMKQDLVQTTSDVDRVGARHCAMGCC